MKKVSEAALNVLKSGVIEGNLFKMNGGQLDRKLYVEVNQVLENIGGKWSRKESAHLFDGDPSERLDAVLSTGETVNEKQLYQFFATPRNLAERVVELAGVRDGMTLLEPSAGQGALLDALPRGLDIGVTCVELDPKNCSVLEDRGYGRAFNEDFMGYTPGGDGELVPAFERVIMNPPFTKQQDIDHVTRAYVMVTPGGRLVAIMSPGFTFRQNNKSLEFKQLVEQFGHYEVNDVGAFKESGTMIRTVTVVLNKPPQRALES